ncbi:HpcH/HpaI aldolase family protein [Enteractinococcus helveticum]|uniref:Aldolase n=1 Tax=Enteractinococcus helveticum TaxID=1837282 RepID=A0A1B7LUJ2_9MICC|nr:aldolase/citrate lyase family protein [Enteractinococcus helveticum]OAV51046.1 aldolase [Enteractinococcus helveticum]
MNNKIIANLQQGKPSYGVNIQTNSPEIVEMVGLSGFDHLMIDWEHGSFGTDSVVSMIRAAQSVGITPIVRVPSNDEVWIKRVLDAGALGVVVPHVSSKADAQRVVSASRYRSQNIPFGDQGRRGACPSVRAANHMAGDWKEFAHWSNENIFVAVAIESPEGVAELKNILEVPGIYAVFLGTFDLAHDMGFYGDNSAREVIQQIDHIVTEAHAANIPLFATLYRGRTDEEVQEEIAVWRDKGAAIFNTISDRRLILQGLEDRAKQLTS